MCFHVWLASNAIINVSFMYCTTSLAVPCSGSRHSKPAVLFRVLARLSYALTVRKQIYARLTCVYVCACVQCAFATRNTTNVCKLVPFVSHPRSNHHRCFSLFLHLAPLSIYPPSFLPSSLKDNWPQPYFPKNRSIFT